MNQMNIIDYLNKHEIPYFPIKVVIADLNDGRGERKIISQFDNSDLIRGAKSYKQATDEFSKQTKEVIKSRHVNLHLYDNIGIDTTDIAQIDVDTFEHKETVKTLTDIMPHFLSMRQQLPHLFVKLKNKPSSHRFQTRHNGIEVLNKQWSYCNKNAIVYNADIEIPTIDYNDICQPESKSEKKESTKKYIPNDTIVDIDILLSHLRPCECDNFDSWWKIGNALFNSGYDKSVYQTFSKGSKKYNYNHVSKQWEDIEKNPMKSITFGTLMYYLSLNDDKDAQLYRNELRANLRTTEQTDELITLYAKGSLTNAGSAKIFYEAFKDKYIFSHNQWYHMTDGGIIKHISFDSDIIIAKALFNYVHKFISDTLLTTTDDDKKKKLWGSIVKMESSQFQMGCVTQLKLCYNDEYLFDKLDLNQKKFIGFTNGIYDLEHGIFRMGTIEDMVSMDVGYDYKPDIDETKTLFFDKLIDGYFKTPETARWFKKHLGSLIQGGNTDEKAFFWTGNGRNGKGTIDTILMNALGPYYHELPVEFFTLADKSSSAPKPEILAMRNRRCCMTHEPEGTVKWLTGKFKKSTGNDPLSARDMYSNVVQKFKPSHKHIIQANGKPEFSDVDNALLTRLVVIDFPFTYCDPNDFDETIETHRRMDTHLKTKLKGSEADFMNYLIHYNVLYQKEGIEDYSDEIKESIETYRKETDTIRSFLNVALTKSTSPDAKIFTTQLLEYHNMWAGTDMTTQAFVKRLKANNIQPKKVRINRVQGAGIVDYVFKPGFVDMITGNACDSDDED